MELSIRLQAVADMVSTGYRLADIGTDHAYIPIYLLEQAKIPYAIAMDVNAGPLKIATEHISSSHLLDHIETRLSDGFARLKPAETDCAILAGMGGGLILRILAEYWEVTKSLKECVLQPQSEIMKVRAFLLEKGFSFIEENMVIDDGKYYSMMKVVPPHNDQEAAVPSDNAGWNEAEIHYGKLLLCSQHPVLKEYLLREIRIKSNILQQLSKQSGGHIDRRSSELQKEIELAGKGLKYFAV